LPHLAFDTLEFAKKLKAANFTAEQAEALAASIAGLVEERLATKQDLKELEARLEVRIKELETGLRRDMQEMELRLRHDLTLRLGAMLVAGIALVATLVKVL